MRIFIDEKNVPKIKSVSGAINRPAQYVVNTIIDYYFNAEDPEKKIKEILTENMKRISLKIKNNKT